MKELDISCTFKGIEYHGRRVYNKNTDESLVMFEVSLGDVFSPFFCGSEECDEETYKQACDIDENIFCYIPKEVLVRSDEEVIRWCEDNSIDV